MATNHISRRGFLAGTSSVAALAALPVGAALPAAPMAGDVLTVEQIAKAKAMMDAMVIREASLVSPYHVVGVFNGAGEVYRGIVTRRVDELCGPGVETTWIGWMGDDDGSP